MPFSSIIISDQPAQHGLVPAKAGTDDDTVQAGEPGVHLLHAVLLVEAGVDDQLRAVAPDDGAGRGLTEDVDTVSPRPQSRGSAIPEVREVRGEEILPVVGRPCEEETTTEYCHPAAVTFPET